MSKFCTLTIRPRYMRGRSISRMNRRFWGSDSCSFRAAISVSRNRRFTSIGSLYSLLSSATLGGVAISLSSSNAKSHPWSIKSSSNSKNNRTVSSIARENSLSVCERRTERITSSCSSRPAQLANLERKSLRRAFASSGKRGSRNMLSRIGPPALVVTLDVSKGVIQITQRGKMIGFPSQMAQISDAEGKQRQFGENPLCPVFVVEGPNPPAWTTNSNSAPEFCESLNAVHVHQSARNDWNRAPHHPTTAPSFLGSVPPMNAPVVSSRQII